MIGSFNTFSSLLICSLALIQLLAGGFFLYFFKIEQLSRKENTFFQQWGISYILTSVGLTFIAVADITTPSLAIFSHVLFFSGLAIKVSSLLSLGNRNSRIFEMLSVIFIFCLLGISSNKFGTVSQSYLAMISVMMAFLGLGIAWAATKAFNFESSFKKILSINFFTLALLHFGRAIIIFTSTHPMAIREDNLTNIITYITGVLFCLFGVFAVIGLGYEILMQKKFTSTINKHHNFENTMLAALNKIAHARSTETGEHTIKRHGTA